MKFPAAIRLFPPGALAALSALTLHAAPPAPQPSAPVDPSKTHTLFMGVDLFVAQNKEQHRVRDVTGGSFVIDVNGQPVFVQMNAMFQAPVNLRVDQQLKLSRVSASLTNLKGERAYTSGNDPRRLRSENQVRLQMVLADQVADAEFALSNALYNASHGGNGPGSGPGSAQELKGAQAVAAAERIMRESTMRMQAIGDGGRFAKELEAELAKELYDAMEVTFEVSSAQPLNNPYVVLITRYHEKDAKPGAVQNWIYAKSLDPIADKPQQVYVKQGGFPRGFVLEAFQVHLYNQGLEVATNVAPKRVPLTANEAMLYLMMDYLGAHQHDTLPPTPALTTLPADFQDHLARGEGKAPLYVKVSKEGRITEAYVDDEYSKRLDDPYFAAAMKEIRFKPALEKGKPVDGRARLKLADLPRGL